MTSGVDVDPDQPINHAGLENLRALEACHVQARAALESHEPTAFDDSEMSTTSEFRRRVVREIASWTRAPDPDGWFTISPLGGDNLHQFLGTIRGPRDTPWEGGIFHLRISLGETYPHLPPRVSFLTKILHPNVDIYGIVCIDLLYPDMWAPLLTLEKILLLIILLLNEPNFELPIEGRMPKDWTSDEEESKARAREWMKKYATGSLVYPGESQDGYVTVCEKLPTAEEVFGRRYRSEVRAS